MIAESESICISDSGKLAARILGDTSADCIVCSCSILAINKEFVFCLEKVDEELSESLEFGVVACSDEHQEVFSNFYALPKVFARDADIFSDSTLVGLDYFPKSLDLLDEQTTLGVILLDVDTIGFMLNGVNLGPINLPRSFEKANVYAFVKLYGRAVKIRLLSEENVKNKVSRNNVDEIQSDVRKGKESGISCEKHEIYESNKLPISYIANSLNYCASTSLISKQADEVKFGNQNIIVFSDTSAPLSFRVSKLAGDNSMVASGPLAIGLYFENYEILDRNAAHFLLNSSGVFMEGERKLADNLKFLKFLNHFNHLNVGSSFECNFHENSFNITLEGSDFWSFPIFAETEHLKLFLDLSFEVSELNVKMLRPSLSMEIYKPKLMDPLRFHSKHGRNCSIEENRLTAFRPDASSEFSDAILITNRRLADNEMFEIKIDSLVSLWSGSLEIGLTLQDPEKIIFPKTMTQITHDIWMISGSAVVYNGDTIWNNYNCDFDKLSEGAEVGIMRTPDGEMHVFLDGKDLGVACVNVPAGCFAICDLYGQCNKVTILHPDRGPIEQGELNQCQSNSTTEIINHEFVPCSTHDFTLTEKSAVRSEKHDSKTSSNIIFSGLSINDTKCFTVKVGLKQNADQIAVVSNFKIGITNFDPILIQGFNSVSFENLSKNWYLCYWHKNKVHVNGTIVSENYSPCLDSIVTENAEISVVFSAENRVSFAWNDFVFAQIDEQINENCYVFIEPSNNRLQSLEVVSSSNKRHLSSKRVRTRTDTVQLPKAETIGHKVECSNLAFIHNSNVVLSSDRQICSRKENRTSCIVMVSESLHVGKAMFFQIEKTDPRLRNKFSVGVSQKRDLVSKFDPEHELRKGTIVSATGVYQNGQLIKNDIYLADTWLQKGNTLGLLVDSNLNLNLIVGSKNVGQLVNDVSLPLYMVLELDGYVTDIRILPDFKFEADIEPEAANCIENLKDVSKSAVYNGNCEYLKKCLQILKMLKIPAKFYASSSKKPCCYCEACVKLRSTETCFKQGEPLKPFTLPTGWCKFNLLTKSTRGIKPDKSSWHIAYHCPQISQLRRILDSAELRLPSSLSTSGITTLPFVNNFGDEKQREKFENMILLSPTVKYCSQSAFCPEIMFKMGENGDEVQAKIALQVWVKPDSYTASIPPDPMLVLDDEIPIGEHEWMTKEKNSTFVSALLIKVETKHQTPSS